MSSRDSSSAKVVVCHRRVVASLEADAAGAGGSWPGPGPVGRGSGVDQRWELELPHDFQEDLDVAVRQGAFNDEELVGMDQGFVFEHAPEALDLVLGPMGEIGQGAFMDLFTSRRPSRRRMAGGELRLGTVSTYMGL